MITVYVSIGNSDDKLTQGRWADFVREVWHVLMNRSVKVHGAWFSAPDSPYQNACWCVEFLSGTSFDPNYKLAQGNLAKLAHVYGQDSIAWAVATTEFI